MIAHDIIVSFCIFSLLKKYDRIFGKKLEHDNYGVKQIPCLALCEGWLPGLVSKFCIIFVYYGAFKQL